MRTVLTGSPMTRTRTVAVLVPAVTEIVVVPELTAVTTPLVLTTAIPGFSLDQARARLVSAVPFGPMSCTVTCRVVVRGRSKLSGVATMDRIGSRTLSEAVASFPPALTTMVVAPEDTAVTSPLRASTVATASFRDLQLSVRPVRVCPAPFLSVTVQSLYVSPSSIESRAGRSVMVAIGSGSVASVHEATKTVSASEAALETNDLSDRIGYLDVSQLCPRGG